MLKTTRFIAVALFCALASIANAQSYTTLHWGIDRTSTPNEIAVKSADGASWFKLFKLTAAGQPTPYFASTFCAANEWITATSGVPACSQPAFSNLSGQATLAQLPTLATNTILANTTSGSAVPTAHAAPSCSAASEALKWTTNTGLGCNNAIAAASFLGLTSGTSGGIPYFSAADTLASSAALTANMPVIGGGAGVAPSVGTKSGNTTAFVTTTGAQTSGDCVKIDANGNHVANGSACAGSSGAWTAYTPTLSCGSGTLTTASASGRWQQSGKTLYISFSIVITTNGTCDGSVIFTLPNSLVATASTSTSGRGSQIGGKMLQLQCLSAANLCNIFNYDNTYPGASGETLIGTMVLEVD